LIVNIEPLREIRANYAPCRRIQDNKCRLVVGAAGEQSKVDVFRVALSQLSTDQPLQSGYCTLLLSDHDLPVNNPVTPVNSPVPGVTDYRALAVVHSLTLGLLSGSTITPSLPLHISICPTQLPIQEAIRTILLRAEGLRV
jgi:hypothetical protein